MPRKPRTLAKSKTYHVMMRGNERKNIFLDDDDRIRFIDTLCEKKKNGEFSLYSYCLMDNHIHLVLAEGKESLCLIMKRINTSFAYHFNKKYKRVGHVFQDRFKSETIENDGHLLAAVRYVHNNPVKAGITASPREYKWSSYNSYLSESASNLVDSKDVLDIFSTDNKRAVKAFTDYSVLGSEDEFIECPRDSGEDLENTGRNAINELLGRYNVTLETLKNKDNVVLRNELIKELKVKYRLSIRQIARLINVNRNVIQRIR